MTTQTATIIAGRRRKWPILAACGAALALAVAIGALQQTATRRSEGGVSAPVPAQTVSVPAAGTSVTAPTPIVYYIASSPEQAAALEWEVAERNRLLAANDERDLRAVVVVAGSDEEAERIRSMVSSVNWLRATEGLPPSPVFDHRGRPF